MASILSGTIGGLFKHVSTRRDHYETLVGVLKKDLEHHRDDPDWRRPLERKKAIAQRALDKWDAWTSALSELMQQSPPEGGNQDSFLGSLYHVLRTGPSQITLTECERGMAGAAKNLPDETLVNEIDQAQHRINEEFENRKVMIELMAMEHVADEERVAALSINQNTILFLTQLQWVLRAELDLRRSKKS